MGKEIIVIDPDDLERQLIQKPAKAGEGIIDLTTEMPGNDPDQIITTTRQPFGKK